MNKEHFWRIVEDVRSSADPRDQEAILFALQEQLRKLPSAEIMEWQETFQFYDDAAYRAELWAASGAMGAHKKRVCSSSSIVTSPFRQPYQVIPC